MLLLRLALQLLQLSRNARSSCDSLPNPSRWGTTATTVGPREKPKTKVTDERYVAIFQLRAFRRLVRPSSAHFLFLLLPAFRANRVFSVIQPIYTAAPATAISPMLLCDQTFQRISSRILAHNEGQIAPESTTDVVPGCPVNTFVHCLRPKFECWWRMDLQARMLVLAFFR